MDDIKEIKSKIETLHILVVDDEDMIRQQMVSFLERFFNKVVSASDGKEGLVKFHEEGPFDIILTDMRMPNMDGYEFITSVKSLDDSLFIAVMSGSPEDMQQASGISDIFLEKPVGLDAMLGFLETVIKKKGL